MANEYIIEQDMTGFLTSPDATILAIAMAAASRLIDDHCERRFYQETAATKTYDASVETVLIDDLTTATSLTLDDTLLVEGTDFVLHPRNEILKQRVALNSTGTDLVIVGDWGPATVPDQIMLACRFIAKRLYLMSVGNDGVKSEKTMTYAVTYENGKLTQTEELLLEPFRKHRRGQD